MGDTVRQSTFVSVRRVAADSAGKPDEYEVQGDVGAEITIARSAGSGQAGKTWQVSESDLVKNGGRVRLKIGSQTADTPRHRLRTRP